MICLKFKSNNFDDLDPTNAENIQLIESSLFILCLDNSVTTKTTQQQQQPRTGFRDSFHMARMNYAYMGSMLLHGGGSHLHTGNRWWDKFLEIIISKEGICGVVMEHSASE
ncbi:choline O-acetyltransferase-like protein, partial [Euroglyphus maynei]